MKTQTINSITLLLDDCRGIYIPRDFANFDLTDWDGIDPDDIEICKQPDHEYYWDAWQNILDHAKHKKHGHSLYQDGSLWAVNYDTITDDEYKEFFGEDRIS
jgi:hypothetical protein